MAEIVLFPSELESGGFPDCCAVCGAASCTPVKQRFSVIVADYHYVQRLASRDGWVPMCARHQSHFRRPLFGMLVAFGTMALGVALGILVGFILVLLIGGPGEPLPAIVGLVIAGAGVIAGLVIARFGFFGRRGMVHANDVTEEGVQLTNVAEEFVQSVKGARAARAPGR